MKYDPEAANANLIPNETWCNAEIVSAEDKLSKANNDMIVAQFKCYYQPGFHPVITHYFVSTAPGLFKKLCLALGLDFESGDIPASEIVGKQVNVLVKIQKDTTGKYGDKNVCAAFSKMEGNSISEKVKEDIASSGKPVEDEEDLPF